MVVMGGAGVRARRVDRGHVVSFVAAVVGVLWLSSFPAGAPASAAGGPSPDVVVSMTSTIGPRDVTGQPFYGQQVVQYNDLVSNLGSADAGTVLVVNPVPGASAVLIPDSPTCGTVPNCTVALRGKRITFTLGSVPAGASGLTLSFQVRIIPRRNVLASVRWIGGGCTKKSCHSKAIVSRVVAPPLVVFSSPPNRGYVAMNQEITYTLAVQPYAYAPGSPDVVVSDLVPDGTSYVPGSATCGTVPGCTSGAAGSDVTFTFSPDSFVATGADEVSFAAVSTVAGGTIIDNATFTGGTCPAGVTCTDRYSIGLNAQGAVAGTVPPSTTVPGGATSSGGGTSSPTTGTSSPTTGTLGGASVGSGATPTSGGATGSGTSVGGGAAAPGLTLSQSSISPYGSTVVRGAQCPPGSQVVISVDGRRESVTNADDQGRFSFRLAPGSLPVGPHQVTAACGWLSQSTTLNAVVTSTASTPESSAAAFGAFVLLGVVLLRGQFDTSATRRRKRRSADEVLATS